MPTGSSPRLQGNNAARIRRQPPGASAATPLLLWKAHESITRAKNLLLEGWGEQVWNGNVVVKLGGCVCVWGESVTAVVHQPHTDSYSIGEKDPQKRHKQTLFQ
jgi:hypothetical protein